MQNQRYYTVRLLWVYGLMAVLLGSCAPSASLSTPTAMETSTPVPSKTPLPTSTLTATPRTPPTLPVPYQNDTLTPFGTPHRYIQNSCQYLRDKWSSTASTPGTVVMVIMFHSITDNTITVPNQTSTYMFRQLMNKLHDDEFQAITTSQLADFMETNAKIPDRSVLLVVDDRHADTYFNKLFREYWVNWGWPVINAWISTDLSTADLWQQQVNLENDGSVDHQAHGYFHNTPIGPDSSEAYILGELQKPIDLFKAYFHKTPIAVIWPGGGFTTHAVQVARQLGYRLGFTVNPRGPLMFNWVPLGDSVDQERISWLAEGPVNDPLMVLPRYWDTDAIIHIPQVLQAGAEAASYAAENKATELDYYDIVCAPKYGPIP